MAEENKPAGTTPAGTDTSTEAATPTPAAQGANGGAGEVDPTWLKGRLEREREAAQKKILKDLGIEKVEDAKTALAELKRRQDAEKTEQQRLAEENAALKKTAERASSLEKTIAARAAKELEALTDEQKAAVAELAGDDPAAQLRAIDTLKPTWKPTQTATPPPKDTAPPRKAPTGAPPDTTDHAARYRELKNTNPFAAARYRALHRDAIDRDDAKG